MTQTNLSTRKTIPRETVVLQCDVPTGVSGIIVEAGQNIEVDRADVGALVADGRFHVAPPGAVVDLRAQLRPEEPAPPAPVRMLWTAGGSSRQFDGRSIGLGDTFEVPPNAAASLLHDGVAEVIGDA